MKTHNIEQSTPEWHEFRSRHHGSSEAAAMLGLSKNIKRDELLTIKKTGTPKEFSDWVEKNIFENGHRVEALAREIIEDRLCEELLTSVFSLDKLSCSVDGITADGVLVFEHKQHSKDLFDSVWMGVLPEEHMPQCQQILLITKAKYVLFVVSDGTAENMATIEVYPDTEYQERIITAWKQFDKDLETFVPPVIKEKITVELKQLPALDIKVNGSIMVNNLPEVKQQVKQFLASINTNLETDEDFVRADAEAKQCRAAAKESKNILDSMANKELADIKRDVEAMAESLNKMGLSLEKLVKEEKENKRRNAVKSAYMLAADHASELAKEIKLINFLVIAQALNKESNFTESTKGLKTIASLENAVNTKRAEVIIALDAAAQNVRKKLAWLTDTGHESLFPDLQQIIMKADDDFQLILKTRIAEHEAKVAAAAQRAIDEAKQKAVNEERSRVAMEQEAIEAAKQKAINEEKTRLELIRQEAESERITNSKEEVQPDTPASDADNPQAQGIEVARIETPQITQHSTIDASGPAGIGRHSALMSLDRLIELNGVDGINSKNLALKIIDGEIPYVTFDLEAWKNAQ